MAYTVAFTYQCHKNSSTHTHTFIRKSQFAFSLQLVLLHRVQISLRFAVGRTVDLQMSQQISHIIYSILLAFAGSERMRQYMHSKTVFIPITNQTVHLMTRLIFLSFSGSFVAATAVVVVFGTMFRQSAMNAKFYVRVCGISGTGNCSTARNLH